MFECKCKIRDGGVRAGKSIKRQPHRAGRRFRASLLLAAWLLLDGSFGAATWAQNPDNPPQSNSSRQPTENARPPETLPPHVVAAQRFLAQRNFRPGHAPPAKAVAARRLRFSGSSAHTALLKAQASAGAAATWQPLGPAAVATANFGLITGRVAAIALDPSDSTGNRLYLGTTGGGVWMANNAGVTTPSSISFTPLTDALAALSGAADASISIGALTVQPGETGVVLAGTGDPNDTLDSYYGAGILRSTDGGNTWSLIGKTADVEDALSNYDYAFYGQGFAGFAWSTVNPQLVVAAVAQAYEGTLVDADAFNTDYDGLFYSTDSGATWHLATITDGNGANVQGPLGPFMPPGSSATAVVWNPVRQLFIAAVRFHGYYQSPDGITWTRMANQPGAALTTAMCPARDTSSSIACPIFRGALAVNPQTGDTFAWTVDLNDQDQGLWQDQCAVRNGSCTNASITFAQQWSTAALETSNLQGPATIADGFYNLTLAAIPSGQETVVLAGANDLWKTNCPVSQGCSWRNTTNSTTCMSAQVGEFQHALAWNAANPLEIFLGNDSGLWRSTDGIGESGPACPASDATHFQNLNSGLGSLAEVVSLGPITDTPYDLMAGLGVNGSAGIKGSAPVADWPQILTGYGGPVAVDPRNSSNWYINNQDGVAIYLCSQAGPCTPASFGSSPVVNDADVGGDGVSMPTPAPFLVDPLDSTQLIIGTCRVWRGPAAGGGWSSSNAISPILWSGATTFPCNGDALIRSVAALKISSSSEVIYAGMYGAGYNGANLPGHVLSAVLNPSSGAGPVWNDLTLNPVVNDAYALNYYGLDISSIIIDSHDPTGNTVYVTVAGMDSPVQQIGTVYRSTNGGATWSDVTANLPHAPANSFAVDPQNANTVYVATDLGVYFTTEIANCAQAQSNCWSGFGTGLPTAPVVSLSAAPAAASAQVLVAGTYGRGIWQTPLSSAATAVTSAVANPSSLVFSNQTVGTSSSPLTVTLQNSGNIALVSTSTSVTGNFSETDNCVIATVAPGSSCTIQVTFTPQATGALSGEMTIFANVYGGQLTVDLTGTGSPAGTLTLSPATLNFGTVEVDDTSTPLQVTAANSSSVAVTISGISVTPPFVLSSNSCVTSSGSGTLAANSDCQLDVEFAPTQAGAIAGLLTLTSAAGIQTVQLNGTGASAPTDTLNPSSLTFPVTPEGQLSSALPVTITNSGGVPLTSISVSVTGPFQQTDNCTTQLAAGSLCTISVVFAPTQTGAATGTLTISDALRAQTVSLAGTGLAAPAFSVNPSSLTFTNQQPGVASSPQSVTITNSGGSSMANVGIAITGAAAASYSVTANTCGAQLNSGSNCMVQIIFTPNATGAIAATLAISSSTPGVAPASIPLNGAGQLSTALAANPAQLNFPVVAAGQSSSAQSVTVTNSSSYAIGSVSLAAPSPFSVSQNTCASGLAAGANCTASVVFQPSAGGSATGTLSVTSPVVVAPATVALSGTGFDFTVSISGPASQTVTPGQQANYTLVITPAGSGGTFTFACGTLPSNALCLFNPSSQSLGAGVQGNIIVEISTGSGSSARLESPGSKHSAFWRVLPLACGLLLLPLGVWRRRRIFRAVVLAVLLAGGISSCTSSGGGTGGGGSGGQGGGSGTPAGTYTIPVNITSTGITQSVNVTLTVN